MDRQIAYPGQIPLETDLLNTNRNTMIALGKLAGAILGTGGIVNGLAVAPTSPASLSVSVGAGEIYQLANVDDTAYSTLPADTTDTVVKQGILLQAATLSCPAPGTSGFSIDYLIEAKFEESDTGSVVLPYYNASNPQQTFKGPNNTGAAQAVTRAGTVSLQAKAGIAAAIGTQTAPAVDAGYIALAVVTVANGQATITSGDISALASAQVLTNSLLGLIQAAVPLTSAIASFSPPVGSMRNGRMSLSAAASSGTFTADQVVVANALNGQPYLLSSYNQTVNLATTGAGGMDTGAAPVSGFVALYAIYNPTTQAASILATNATSAAAPTIYGGANMPAGYTASGLISVWPTNSSGKLVAGLQIDRSVSFAKVNALTSTAIPASPTSVTSTSFPLNARSISGQLIMTSTSASAMQLTIASDANASGTILLSAAVAASENKGIGFSDLLIGTPQTFYYTASNSAGTSTVSVNVFGYKF